MAGVLALPPVHHQLCPELLVVMDISSIGSVSSRSDRLLDKLQHLSESCSKLWITLSLYLLCYLCSLLKKIVNFSVTCSLENEAPLA